MKNFGKLLASAVLGSALTVGIFQVSDLNKKVVTIEKQSEIPASKTNFTLTEDGEAVTLDFTKAAELVTPAVVHIKSTAKAADQQSQIPDQFREYFGPMFRGPEQPKVGSGSGVIISEDGYIVTNNHVIANADELEVTLNDNEKYTAEVIGTDESTDIALIKIDTDKKLPSLSFVDSNSIKVGEWVLAVGNPYNLNSTVTAGIVSAKARSIGIIDTRTSREDANEGVEAFIQTDAAVNPGNSGGALVNLQGGLIGINTAIASPTGSYSGYSFAVPSNIVSKVVEDLLEFGTVQRGWLGVTITPIEFSEDDNIEVNNGAYIRNLAENSGAKEAGIKKGDVITNIDGREIRTNTDVIGYVSQKRPGDKISVTVDRYGEEKTFTVELKNRAGKPEVVEIDKFMTQLGVELEEADEETLRESGLSNGVVVKKLNRGLIRDYTKIEEGFIITKIGNRRVESVDDVRKILESEQGSGVLIEGRYKGSDKNEYYALGLN